MKRILTLILIALLLTGCVGGKTKILNVHWEFKDGEDIGVASTKPKIDFDRIGIAGDRNLVTITADVNGKTDGDFEFLVDSKNPYKKVSNNILEIEPLHREEGTVTVVSEGITKEIDYDIFGRGIIYLGANIFEPNRVSGFNFETGELVHGEEGDLTVYWGDRDAIHGNFAEPVPLDGVFGHLQAVNNLDELEYKESTYDIRDAWGKMHFVKCKVGYAAFLYYENGFFIYKYSETGKF